MEKGKKTVQKQAGLNWGLQGGHSSITATYVEAYIPIRATHIDRYPALFPPNQLVKGTSGGKNDPFDVLWDDGTVLRVVYQGDGAERPTKANRTPTDPYRLYPKQLTADSGGSELGKDLRERMMANGVLIGPKNRITYALLKKYGRDSVQFTLTPQGYFEADFSV